MQLSTLLVAIMAATASATCHKSGDTWNNKAAARSAVTSACTGRGRFTGTFLVDEIRRICVNSGGNQKMEFEVQNKGGEPRNWDNAECIYRLNNEIDGCRENMGGYNNVDNWSYGADPNAGRC
ncbi:hypothetical protein QBC42DRAFT_228841 [Cladorrhinum samala]|uniref:Uncharacterized protein n=1 Tax=Cladorrhinum samala TaxID=585594 RepID=A0AAV9HIN6_9PEZI|nr:hypothetical protein QBC42DRAFT_228841 [Cladorrhinum samala]